MSVLDAGGPAVAGLNAAAASASAAVRVALIATFTARPGQAASVEELLLSLTARVREEPGNLAFDPARGVDDHDRFTVYEVYSDRAAFEAHIAADYGATFNTALAPLIVEDGSQLEFLSPLARVGDRDRRDPAP
ncbi:putative quinol monooxygenase [Leifsonia flava]|uniref:putative quinol monooxygenase n=1 Tax=Orlajensenia leifsoniae TaxID=2561933 RepID=UPI001F029EC0|nr:putative quinol monooxygenase [Leifsonia flava]